MLKKIVCTLSLASVLMLNHSCYYMTFDFKEHQEIKPTLLEITVKSYDLKLIETKIDTENRKFTGKVKFTSEYQQKVIRSTNRPVDDSGGFLVFIMTWIKLPLFLAAAFLFGSEANKGNINIPLGAVSSLFVLDFASLVILSFLGKPTIGDYHIIEEFIDRTDLKTENYENLVNATIKVNCNYSLYDLHTDKNGALEINSQDIKQLTKDNLLNNDCYLDKVLPENKKELKVKEKLNFFSWLPADYLNLFSEYMKKPEKVDLHIKTDFLKLDK